MSTLVAALVAMLLNPAIAHVEGCKHERAARKTAQVLGRAILRAEAATGVNQFVIAAVAVAESGGDQRAVGALGEIGVMQVHPEKQAKLYCRGLNLHRVQDNVLCGARLLAVARKACGGEALRWASAYSGRACGESNYSRRVIGVRNRAAAIIGEY